MSHELAEKAIDCLGFIAGNPRKEYAEWMAAYEVVCDKWSQKAVEAKLEQLAERGYVEYGVSVRTGWLTDKGREALEQATSA